jgi:hypothetical protein
MVPLSKVAVTTLPTMIIIAATWLRTAPRRPVSASSRPKNNLLVAVSQCKSLYHFIFGRAEFELYLYCANAEFSMNGNQFGFVM